MTLNELKSEIDKLVEAGNGDLNVLIDIGLDNVNYWCTAEYACKAFLDNLDGQPFDEEFWDEEDKDGPDMGEAVISIGGAYGE